VAAGVPVAPVLWDAPRDWTAYRGVLLRSPWDYFEHAAKFRAWLDELERERVPCWNPVPLVRWNMDKRYLRDLEARGVPIVPTLWFDGADARAPDAIAERVASAGWPEVVVKPTVSGGAWRTLRLRREEVAAHGEHLKTVLAESGLMVQPFLPEILAEGEYSFVFFDGAYSHAAQKRAKPGDYRVQWTHGGTHVPAAVSRALVAQAEAALAAAPEPGLYARVDGVVRDGRLLLMELEQIEPYLFFAQGPGSAERFVAALSARL
jgi:glutathione synthase/RimK-type ligase-like ATP-grasp enzyme